MLVFLFLSLLFRSRQEANEDGFFTITPRIATKEQESPPRLQAPDSVDSTQRMHRSEALSVSAVWASRFLLLLLLLRNLAGALQSRVA